MSRFLFVLDISFDRGGPSVHLLQDVLRAALQRGHKIDVILKKTDIDGVGMPDEFVQNSNFMFVCIPEGNEKKRSFLSRYLSEVKYARKCYNLFKDREKYDAAFLQSNTTAIFYINYLRKLKCPIVFNVQDIFPYNLKYSNQLPLAAITFPIFRKLQHMAYMKADRIITISDDMKITLIKDGLPAEKCDVVYNWSYSDSPINENSIAAENYYDLHTDKTKLNVIYAGNIGKMQNVELIAETSNLLREDDSIHFYFIGDGANKHNVESIVKGNTNVTVLPMLGSNYAESIYVQADVNVIPLVTGGIKTALPSKTATCLRVNKPIIFCIGQDSEFKGLFIDEPRCIFTSSEDPEELLFVINSLKCTKQTEQKDTLTQHPFCSEENSKKYIEIMENMGSLLK